MRTGYLKSATFAALSLGFGVLLALLGIELGLRIVDWPSPGLYRGREGPLALSLPDENGGSWRAYPGPARLRHWDYDVEVHLNAHGFIERENAPKAAGEWRVGLFGDSFTAGMGVPPEQRFGDLWRRAQRRTHAGLSVYNFGSAWTGAAHSAAFLAKHGDAYRLDEVVLALFGGNEFGDNRSWEENRRLDAAQRAVLEERMRAGSWRSRLRNSSRAAGFLYVRSRSCWRGAPPSACPRPKTWRAAGRRRSARWRRSGAPPVAGPSASGTCPPPSNGTTPPGARPARPSASRPAIATGSAMPYGTGRPRGAYPSST